MQVSMASAATTATSVAEPHKFVVTVGCFDLFHHGHSALLSHMRALGATKLLVGVHDDQSIFLNKKLVVGQLLPQRVKEVINFDPQLIEVFEVYEQDPTSALKNIYFHHQRLAQDKGYTIDWVYMRGKDMPMFPGRSFIESVMPIEWHDYSADISSTMIRNDVLPLAKSLANFAQDGCCNDNMLRLLERAATIDHKLVMKYVLQVMGERSPTLASATNASSVSTLQPLSLPPASFEAAPSAIDSVPHMHVASALASPVTLETVNKNNRWLRLNTTTTGINNSMSRRSSLTSDSTPDDHVSQSEADDASPSSAGFHHHRYDDSSYSSANNSPRVNESSASPLASDSPASVDGGGKEKLLLSIIDGLFTLYRARVQQEK